MSSQMGLFKEKRTIQERFEAFNKENPHVYNLLVRFAREAKAAGLKRYSIVAVYERARWHVFVEIKQTDNPDYKLNDNFRSRFARLIMAQEKDLEGFFETRKLTAD